MVDSPPLVGLAEPALEVLQGDIEGACVWGAVEAVEVRLLSAVV